MKREEVARAMHMIKIFTSYMLYEIVHDYEHD